MIAGIPLEGLPTSAGKAIIDEVEIAYLYSTHDVLPSKTTNARSPALVLGNPNYGAARRESQLREPEEFGPLPGAEQEARSVAAILKVPPVLGLEATKSRVQAARGPAVLHFATHGIFGDLVAAESRSSALNWVGTLSAPLRRCAIALAGSNSDPGNGLLSAEEVVALDLHGTQLVTLSTCDSASGEIQLGKGVLGFARAFAVRSSKRAAHQL
jgi:CHAT domain-containing protein